MGNALLHCEDFVGQQINYVINTSSKNPTFEEIQSFFQSIKPMTVVIKNICPLDGDYYIKNDTFQAALISLN